MGITVAISTEGDQIFVCVVTQPASRVDVVHLETIGTAAILASPSVVLEHFGVEFAIRIWVEPESRSPWSEITHWTSPFAELTPFSADPEARNKVD
jgi:hypothetical protein